LNTLLTTTTGKVAPFPGAKQIRGEFAVEDQLHALGIDAWTPRKITFVRRGKKRHPEPITDPYLPGYVFADIPAELFHRALEARGAFATTMSLSRADKDSIARFRRRVDEENAEAERIIARNDRAAMCQWTPGQALEILSGPFADKIVKFARLSLAGEPHIEFEAELFGQVIKGKVDVLDVKAAQ